MGTWSGFAAKKPEGATKTDAPAGEPSRQGITRMGTWGFGKNAANAEGKAPVVNQDEEEDDRRIRFTIGGAGRRLTKEDFLKEIQSLDPKARCEIIEDSDAPKAMKDMARKDARTDTPGSSRLYEAKDAQLTAGAQTARAVGKQMAMSHGALADEPLNAKRTSPPGSSSSNDVPESAAEKRRRQEALKGVVEEEDEEEDVGRSRGRSATREEDQERPEERETAAERRRREAALGEGVQSDSDDDDTPRVPPPARSRGIRFATSPVRGKR